jgi:hypothetical protein
MSTTNPYVIRADLLNLAVDFCTKQYEANMTTFRELYAIQLSMLESGTETSVKLAKDELERLQKSIPVYPDFSQMMDKANSLYAFVNNTK